MNKICVIGGSGFVGSRLIELLLKNNYDVINLDKKQSPFYPEITKIANVLEPSSLNNLLEGVNTVVLLAAEHRDDVSPTSLYYEVNVQGMKNTLEAMRQNNIKNIIFTSSVAVYGLNKNNPDETHEVDPFNHYGKSKWEAELVLQQWARDKLDFNINILRPTVIFGERNRGNVYNLLRQIASGRFLMIGKGENKKSMAYVGNVVAFIEFLIHSNKVGYNVYNYVDKPDFSMNQLVSLVGSVLNKKIPTIHINYQAGFLVGLGFDFLSFVTKKKYAVSSVRVRKFCATTQFDALKALNSGFKKPYSLSEGLSRTLKFEFLTDKYNEITFETE